VARHFDVRSLLAWVNARLTPSASPYNRGARLLSPRLIQPTGINAIEPEFVDKPQHNCLRCLVVACDGQGNAYTCTCAG
jgi:hypothetical protein